MAASERTSTNFEPTNERKEEKYQRALVALVVSLGGLGCGRKLLVLVFGEILFHFVIVGSLVLYFIGIEVSLLGLYSGASWICSQTQ